MVSVCGATRSLDQRGIETAISSKELANDFKHVAYIKICTKELKNAHKSL